MTKGTGTSRFVTGLFAVVACVMFAGCGSQGRGPAPKGEVTTQHKDAQGKPVTYRIEGPYRHENLCVFLIHGQDRITGKDFLTLSEALETRKLVIHETSDVNELSVENLSDCCIFVQSGEIIRGGKQDRVLQYDLVIDPKSGKKPISVFCVEQGRWRGREDEAVAYFSASNNQVAGNDMRLATVQKGDQQAVWQEVAKAQGKLGEQVGGSVQSDKSATSMELTLEHEKVNKAVQAHVARLSGIIEGKKDVIGYAVAINGQVESVDLYGANALFRKLWPKLLKAGAVAAVVERKEGKEFPAIAAADVDRFMKDAQTGKTSQKKVSDSMLMKSVENARIYRYAASAPSGEVHDSMIRQ